MMEVSLRTKDPLMVLSLTVLYQGLKFSMDSEHTHSNRRVVVVNVDSVAKNRLGERQTDHSLALP